MTVFPFLDIQATPIRSVTAPRVSRTKSVPRVTDDNTSILNQSLNESDHENQLLPKIPVRCSIPSMRKRSPKIKILRRSDDLLKRLPHEKFTGSDVNNPMRKPLIRELPDYDYLWEPLQREDIRHQYDFYVAPQRILASRPDEPEKMTTMFETQDRHYHNYRRVRAMQQRQWNREHIQYTTYPYAKALERELYNKQIRSTLKEQIENKIQADKNEQALKSFESQILIMRDKKDLEQEKEKQNQRARMLFKITTKNKELMENKWEFEQWNRLHQWYVERAALADDPINWSKTMT